MKASEIMEKYQITRNTLYRWVKDNKISFTILPSGRYDYLSFNHKNEKPLHRKNVIYARVSSTTQKDNLPRQIDRIKSFASANGFIIDSIYSEVASALNYNRKFYRKLFDEIIENKIDKVFIEYKDRLLRIGFDDFLNLCKKFNTTVVVLDNTNDNQIDKHKEITDDLTSIIHHFSSKIYSARRIKKITDTINENVSTENLINVES